jgi:hypothetical protein
LAAYQTYNFVLKATKGEKTIIVTAILIIVELNIPPLITSYLPGYNERPILLSEELHFSLQPQANQNPD